MKCGRSDGVMEDLVVHGIGGGPWPAIDRGRVLWMNLLFLIMQDGATMKYLLCDPMAVIIP